MKPLGVLIINPPVRISDKPRHIPHGLAILANCIRKKLAIEPVFLDINAHRYSQEEIEEFISKIDFDIVLMGGIATVYRSIIELSSIIKRQNPRVKIIVGGYVAMPIPDLILDNAPVDIVCTGEGEITLTNLIELFQEQGLEANLSLIKGICFREPRTHRIVCSPPRPHIKNLDRESMLPAYDLLPMEIYLSNPAVGIGRDIDYISSRGCPFKCSFCYQPFGRKPRMHSVDFIISSLDQLKKNYAIDFISFQDDEFMLDKKRVIEFCKRKTELFPDLLWSCTGRVNIIANNENIVELMQKSGCVLISCGFESGSQRMLENMNKGQKIKDMEKTISILRKLGLPVPVSFIIGMPGENEETCQETIDFCIRNIIPLDSLMYATPYPGSELFEFALRTRRITPDKLHQFMLHIGDARDFLVNLTDAFTDEQLVQKREEMMNITREHYEKHFSPDLVAIKMKTQYGPLLDRIKLDAKDLEHRAKHGGMSIY